MAASALRLPGAPQHSMLDHPPPAEKIDVPEGGATLPMEDIGGRPLVEAGIDGKGPYRFILDTGASITVVDSDLRTELGLSAPHGAATTAPEEGIGGTVRIGELRVGKAVLRGVVAAFAPIGHMFPGASAPRGVLSASSFPGCLLVLDYPSKRIVIRKGELPPADARSVFQYTEEHILPNVPVRIAGTEVRVHVDTGSPGALTVPTRYMKELPLASEPAKMGQARTPGGEFTIWTAEVKGGIELGQFKLDLHGVEFSDVNPIPGQVVGNIGYRVLKRFVVTLDSKNRRVRFEE